jgi:hypothetical protein
MDDGVAVEIVEVGENPRFKFGLGSDTDVAEHGSRHFGEEAFHEVEPGAVFRREHEGEAALWLHGKPGLGLLGDMSGVVVEDQLDGGIRGIGCVKFLEESNELAGPMAILDAGVHLAGEQIDPSEQAQRAVAFVFVIAREGGMRSRQRWQIGRGVADCLQTGFLVVGLIATFVATVSLSRRTATSR